MNATATPLKYFLHIAPDVSHPSSMSTDNIIGYAIAAAIVAALIVFLIFYYCFRTKRKPTATSLARSVSRSRHTSRPKSAVDKHYNDVDQNMESESNPQKTHVISNIESASQPDNMA